MIEIDVRGLSCPIPVVKTKKAVEDKPNEIIAVLVDSAVARENVSRLATSIGYNVNIENVAGEEFRLTLEPVQ
jgi:tRNA 2-thiouridine synthesizing protein A